METDVLWAILGAVRSQVWIRLYILDLRIYTSPEFSKCLPVLELRKDDFYWIFRDELTEEQIYLWLLLKKKKNRIIDNVFYYGYGDLYRRILTKNDKCYIFVVFCKAAKYGKLEMLKWMAEKFNLVKGNRGAYDSPGLQITEGRVVGEYEDNDFFDSDFSANNIELTAFYDAACNCHINVLEWLVRYFKITKEDVAVTESPSMENVGNRKNGFICKWMKSKSIWPY